jgi:3,2-trans-enoyl-CoA isomerase
MFRRIGSRAAVRGISAAAVPLLAVAPTVAPSTCAVSTVRMQRAFQGSQGRNAGRQAPPPQEESEAQQPPPPPKQPEKPPTLFKYAVNEKGVLTLKLARAPVNSLNLDLFRELNEWLLWFGYDESVKAVVLTSDIPMVFSAGLDINELYKPNVDRFREFWTNFQEAWMILNTFPKPVVAAITGNSPAGGCVLACCADYRVMAKAPAANPERPYRIGLNETKLGIVAPPWVMSSYSYILGTRKAERMLQLGETPTAVEAQALGLVDAVVEEADCIPTAIKEAEKLLAIPTEARWMSKDMMRRELFQFMSTEQDRQYDCDFFTQMISNPDVQGNIGKYLERLGGGKKK